MQVLRPRFHGKLFKAPGSVSYRRLFPFLMDIMGDVSGNCFAHQTPYYLLIALYDDLVRICATELIGVMIL